MSDSVDSDRGGRGASGRKAGPVSSAAKEARETNMPATPASPVLSGTVPHRSRRRPAPASPQGPRPTTKVRPAAPRSDKALRSAFLVRLQLPPSALAAEREFLARPRAISAHARLRTLDPAIKVDEMDVDIVSDGEDLGLPARSESVYPVHGGSDPDPASSADFPQPVSASSDFPRGSEPEKPDTDEDSDSGEAEEEPKEKPRSPVVSKSPKLRPVAAVGRSGADLRSALFHRVTHLQRTEARQKSRSASIVTSDDEDGQRKLSSVFGDDFDRDGDLEGSRGRGMSSAPDRRKKPLNVGDEAWLALEEARARRARKDAGSGPRRNRPTRITHTQDRGMSVPWGREAERAMKRGEAWARSWGARLLRPRGPRERRPDMTAVHKGDKEWTKSTSLERCEQCNSQFTMLRRKHHCRACGSLVCAECSPYHINTELSRVCRRCHALYKGRVLGTSDKSAANLLDAASEDDVYEVRYRLSRGQSAGERVPPHGWSALHGAAASGSCRVLRVLLEEGHVPVEQRCFAGRTALHYAAEGGHGECMGILLEHGAGPMSRDDEGLTPADLAHAAADYFANGAAAEAAAKIRTARGTRQQTVEAAKTAAKTARQRWETALRALPPEAREGSIFAKPLTLPSRSVPQRFRQELQKAAVARGESPRAAALTPSLRHTLAAARAACHDAAIEVAALTKLESSTTSANPKPSKSLTLQLPPRADMVASGLPALEAAAQALQANLMALRNAELRHVQEKSWTWHPSFSVQEGGPSTDKTPFSGAASSSSSSKKPIQSSSAAPSPSSSKKPIQSSGAAPSPSSSSSKKPIQSSGAAPSSSSSKKPRPSSASSSRKHPPSSPSSSSPPVFVSGGYDPSSARDGVGLWDRLACKFESLGLIASQGRMQHSAGADEGPLIGTAWRLGHVFGPDVDLSTVIADAAEKSRRKSLERRLQQARDRHNMTLASAAAASSSSTGGTQTAAQETMGSSGTTEKPEISSGGGGGIEKPDISSGGGGGTTEKPDISSGGGGGTTEKPNISSGGGGGTTEKPNISSGEGGGTAKKPDISSRGGGGTAKKPDISSGGGGGTTEKQQSSESTSTKQHQSSESTSSSSHHRSKSRPSEVEFLRQTHRFGFETDGDDFVEDSRQRQRSSSLPSDVRTAVMLGAMRRELEQHPSSSSSDMQVGGRAKRSKPPLVFALLPPRHRGSPHLSSTDSMPASLPSSGPWGGHAGAKPEWTRLRGVALPEVERPHLVLVDHQSSEPQDSSGGTSQTRN